MSRFIPDRSTVARAQRHLLGRETHQERYVRQRWEEASGANRVTILALRDIFPSEVWAFTHLEREELEAALEHVTEAFVHLDNLSERMLGSTMRHVLVGHYTAEDLDSLGVPGDDDET